MHCRFHPGWPLILVTIALGCGGDARDPEGATEAATSPSTAASEGGPTSPTDASASNGSDGPSAGSTGDPDSAGSSTGVNPTGDSSVDSSDSGTVPAEPVVVAVGYGGVRVRSVDRGFTWTDPTELAVGGGDDMNLLRAAAWGNDRFVAAGFRIFSSPDGAQWTEHENPSPQWIGALAFGNGMFLGAGGGGLCARSADGVDWNPCTDVTDDAEFTHVRSVLFFEDRFWAASADGVLRSSPDGDTWAVEDLDFGTPWAGIVANQIAPVEETAPADLLDFRLQGVFAGLIQRAPARSDAFETVFEVPADNRIFQAYRFSFTVGFPQGS